MRHSLPSRTRAKGFTLIELLIVLGVLGLLIFFATRNGEKADYKTNANAFTTQQLILVDAINSTYRFNQFTGLTAQNLCESRSNGIHDQCSGSGASATIRNDFGGTVTPAAASCNGGTNNCFTVTSTNIPGPSCATIVSTLQGKASTIRVGSTTVKSSTVPYNQATVNTTCNADTSTLTLTIG